MIAFKTRENKEVNLDAGLENFESQWPEISTAIARAHRLTSDETKWLKNKNVARLIAAIPYLAGCESPKQTATAHLSIYLLSVNKESKSLFHHQEWVDDNYIKNRLRPIMNFNEGDQIVIDRAMNLLTLNMLCGYYKDMEKDFSNGKYNPLGKGAWNYESMKSDLIEKITAVSMPQMDEIMNMDDGTDTLWGGA